MHYLSKSHLAREQFYLQWWLRALKGLRYGRFHMVFKSVAVLLISSLVDTKNAALWLLESMLVGPRLVRRVGPGTRPLERHEFQNENQQLQQNLWR